MAKGILIVEGNRLGDLEKNILAIKIDDFDIEAKHPFCAAKEKGYRVLMKEARKKGANLVVLNTEGYDSGFPQIYSATGTYYRI